MLATIESYLALPRILLREGRKCAHQGTLVVVVARKVPEAIPMWDRMLPTAGQKHRKISFTLNQALTIEMLEKHLLPVAGEAKGLWTARRV